MRNKLYISDKILRLELPNDIAGLQALILELLKRVETLESENKELKAKLNANSSNSSRPPSSDGLKKKPAFPKEKSKKRGGQKGHKGNTLKMVKTADYVVELCPPKCICGTSLLLEKKKNKSVRQVFDLPTPQLEVTEYQQQSCVCPSCGKTNTGKFPKGISPNAQYGNGVRALVTLLNINYKIPFKKIKRLFKDLYGYSINESTQINTLNNCYNLLEGTEVQIKDKLLRSQVNHFDETGLRVAGKLHWLHTSSSNLYTYLFVHANRGKKALADPVSLLPDYKGWAVHDCWYSYFKFDQCNHSLCGAHLLRELQGLIDRKSIWAREMHELFLDIYNQTNQGKSKLNKSLKFIRKYNNICRKADKEEPPPIINPRGKPKQTKGRNLMNRLVKYKDAVLAFAKYTFIPFTNNLAERDVRHAKVKQKVAGSFRTKHGADIYARIYSFVSTLRKHQLHKEGSNLNIFKELVAVFDRKSFNFSQI